MKNTARRGAYPLRPTPGKHFEPVIVNLAPGLRQRLDNAAIAAGYESRSAFIRIALERAVRPFEPEEGRRDE